MRPCCDFLQGVCGKGAACSESHEPGSDVHCCSRLADCTQGHFRLQSSLRGSRKEASFCCNFLKGICKYGEKCCFSHRRTGIVTSCNYGTKCKCPTNHWETGLEVMEILQKAGVQVATDVQAEAASSSSEAPEQAINEILCAFPGEALIGRLSVQVQWAKKFKASHGSLLSFLCQRPLLYSVEVLGEKSTVQLVERQDSPAEGTDAHHKTAGTILGHSSSLEEVEQRALDTLKRANKPLELGTVALKGGWSEELKKEHGQFLGFLKARPELFAVSGTGPHATVSLADAPDCSKVEGKIVRAIAAAGGRMPVNVLGIGLQWPQLKPTHGPLQDFLLARTNLFEVSHPKTERASVRLVGPGPAQVAADTVPQAEPSPSSELSKDVGRDQEASLSSANPAPSPAQAGPSEPNVELCVVTADVIPQGSDQLELKEGDEVLISWRQPVNEGGDWAYGHRCSSPERVGYIPLRCLDKPHAGGPASCRVEVSLDLGPLLDLLDGALNAADLQRLEALLQMDHALTQIVLVVGQPAHLISCSRPKRPLTDRPSTQEEMDRVAAACDSLRTSACLHRAAVVSWPTGGVRSLSIRLGRLAKNSSLVLKDACQRPLLLLGPTGSGKTTMLRDLAASLLIHDHAVAIDAVGDLFGPGAFHAGPLHCLLPPRDARLLEVVENALADLAPQVLVVNFSSLSALLDVAAACAASGVVLIAACCSSFQHAAQLCGKQRFSFQTVAELIRPGHLRVFHDAEQKAAALLQGKKVEVELREVAFDTGDVTSWKELLQPGAPALPSRSVPGRT